MRPIGGGGLATEKKLVSRPSDLAASLCGEGKKVCRIGLLREILGSDLFSVATNEGTASMSFLVRLLRLILLHGILPVSTSFN